MITNAGNANILTVFERTKDLHVIKCAHYVEAERELHEQYAAKRVNGEWFNLDENDIAHIKSIERL